MLRLKNGRVVLGQGVQVAGNPPIKLHRSSSGQGFQIFTLGRRFRIPYGVPNKMADGTAWCGHLPVTQEFRGDRYPYRSPIYVPIDNDGYIVTLSR